MLGPQAANKNGADRIHARQSCKTVFRQFFYFILLFFNLTDDYLTFLHKD